MHMLYPWPISYLLEPQATTLTINQSMSCGQESRPQIFPENPGMYLEKYAGTRAHKPQKYRLLACAHTYTEYLCACNTDNTPNTTNEKHIYTHPYTHETPNLLVIHSLQSWAYICSPLITYYPDAPTFPTHNTLEHT